MSDEQLVEIIASRMFEAQIKLNTQGHNISRNFLDLGKETQKLYFEMARVALEIINERTK